MGFPGGASGKEPTCQCRLDPQVGKIPWRRKWQPTPVFLPENPMDRGALWVTVHGVTKSHTRLKQPSVHWVKCFTIGSAGKESSCNAGDTGDVDLIPGLGRSSGGGNGNPVQYSCLQNPKDRGVWWVTVHGVARSQTWLSTSMSYWVKKYIVESDVQKSLKLGGPLWLVVE